MIQQQKSKAKTNTLIENLANCPTDKRNVIYKQSAKSIEQGKKLNKLEWHLSMLKPTIAMNTLLAKSAGKKGKKAFVRNTGLVFTK